MARFRDSRFNTGGTCSWGGYAPELVCFGHSAAGEPPMSSGESQRVNSGECQPSMSFSADLPSVNTTSSQALMNSAEGRPHMENNEGQPPMSSGESQPPMTFSTGRPHMETTESQPPMSSGEGQPPMTFSAGRPHMETTQGQPPMRSGESQPHMTFSAGRPHMETTQGQPPMRSGESQPHMTFSAGRPDIENNEGQPPMNTSEPSNNIAASQPSIILSADKPLMNTAVASQPLKNTTADQPPMNSAEAQPPMNSGGSPSPVNSTAGQPNMSTTTGQPPMNRKTLTGSSRTSRQIKSKYGQANNESPNSAGRGIGLVNLSNSSAKFPSRAKENVGISNSDNALRIINDSNVIPQPTQSQHTTNQFYGNVAPRKSNTNSSKRQLSLKNLIAGPLGSDSNVQRPGRYSTGSNNTSQAKIERIDLPPVKRQSVKTIRNSAAGQPPLNNRASQPRTTYLAGQPSINSATRQPSTTFSNGQPTFNATTDEHSMTLSADQPNVNSANGQPPTNTTADQPSTPTTTGQPPTTTTTGQPPTTTTTGQPPTTTTTGQPPIIPTTGQPSTTKTTGQPPTTTTTGQPPIIPTTGQPPTTTTTGQPSTTKTTGQPLTNVTASQVSTNTTLIQPPMLATAGQPPIITMAGQPTTTTTTGQPPIITTAGQPPLTMTAGQPPMITTASQPPLTMTAGQPPIITMAGQPTTTTTTGQPSIITTAGQPPATMTTGQPPTTTTTGQPPTTTTTGQPPTNVTASQVSTNTALIQAPKLATASPPPTTTAAGQPPMITTASQPPLTMTAGQPPMTMTAGQPTIITTAGQRPTTTTTGQPPTTTTTGQPRVITTTGQPPIITTTGQPPIITTTGQPPIITTTGQPPTTMMTDQPPMTMTAGQPPMTMTAGQPPMTMTAGQPPTTMTTDQPPITMTAGQPPMTMTAGQPPTTMTTGQPPMIATAGQATLKTTADERSMTLSANQPNVTSATGQPPTSTTSSHPSMNTEISQPSMILSADQPNVSSATGQPPMNPAVIQAPRITTAGQPHKNTTQGLPSMTFSASQPTVNSTAGQTTMKSIAGQPLTTGGETSFNIAADQPPKTAATSQPSATYSAGRPRMNSTASQPSMKKKTSIGSSRTLGQSKAKHEQVKKASPNPAGRGITRGNLSNSSAKYPSREMSSNVFLHTSSIVSKSAGQSSELRKNGNEGKSDSDNAFRNTNNVILPSSPAGNIDDSNVAQLSLPNNTTNQFLGTRTVATRKSIANSTNTVRQQSIKNLFAGPGGSDSNVQRPRGYQAGSNNMDQAKGPNVGGKFSGRNIKMPDKFQSNNTTGQATSHEKSFGGRGGGVDLSLKKSQSVKTIRNQQFVTSLPSENASPNASESKSGRGSQLPPRTPFQYYSLPYQSETKHPKDNFRPIPSSATTPHYNSQSDANSGPITPRNIKISTPSSNKLPNTNKYSLPPRSMSAVNGSNRHQYPNVLDDQLFYQSMVIAAAAAQESGLSSNRSLRPQFRPSNTGGSQSYAENDNLSDFIFYGKSKTSNENVRSKSANYKESSCVRRSSPSSLYKERYHTYLENIRAQFPNQVDVNDNPISINPFPHEFHNTCQQNSCDLNDLRSEFEAFVNSEERGLRSFAPPLLPPGNTRCPLKAERGLVGNCHIASPVCSSVSSCSSNCYEDDLCQESESCDSTRSSISCNNQMNPCHNVCCYNLDSNKSPNPVTLPIPNLDEVEHASRLTDDTETDLPTIQHLSDLSPALNQFRWFPEAEFAESNTTLDTVMSNTGHRREDKNVSNRAWHNLQQSKSKAFNSSGNVSALSDLDESNLSSGTSSSQSFSTIRNVNNNKANSAITRISPNETAYDAEDEDESKTPAPMIPRSLQSGIPTTPPTDEHHPNHAEQKYAIPEPLLDRTILCSLTEYHSPLINYLRGIQRDTQPSSQPNQHENSREEGSLFQGHDRNLILFSSSSSSSITIGNTDGHGHEITNENKEKRQNPLSFNAAEYLEGLLSTAIADETQVDPTTRRTPLGEEMLSIGDAANEKEVFVSTILLPSILPVTQSSSGLCPQEDNKQQRLKIQQFRTPQCPFRRAFSSCSICKHCNSFSNTLNSQRSQNKY
ncbi:mucin-5AC [Folsomia candida]|uniref:mucin-5AC n=1 Tax=Folsomia candida TaxID=158441 RepID=UPI000B8F7DA8|nr:mucin-5AC [Folsomia candida]